MTVTQKYNYETWFFFLFSRLLFFHVNLTIFEKKKNWIFMLQDQNLKKSIFFQKWSNLRERTAIGWVKRKTKFQIFPIFIFRVMQKNTVAEKSLNAVEREPVLIRVLNPKARGVQGGEAPRKKNNCLVFLRKKICKFFKFTWKIQNRLNRKKNQVSDFTDFLFFELLLF